MEDPGDDDVISGDVQTDDDVDGGEGVAPHTDTPHTGRPRR